MKKCTLLIMLALMPSLSIAKEKDQVAEDNFRKAITAAGGEDRFKTIEAPTMWMETGTYYGMGEGTPFVAQYATYWPKRWYRPIDRRPIRDWCRGRARSPCSRAAIPTAKNFPARCTKRRCMQHASPGLSYSIRSPKTSTHAREYPRR